MPIHNYEKLAELLHLCSAARNEAESATYLQFQLFQKLCEYGFLEETGFEHLPAEMEQLKQAKQHYDMLMDSIMQHLHKIREAIMVIDEMSFTAQSDNCG